MAVEEAVPVAPVTPVPRKKGRGRLLVMAIVVLLVLAGGTGGAWWWFRRPVAAAAAPVEADPRERGLVSFEPFLVNLADAGGTRFLKVNVELVVDKAEAAEEIEKTPVIKMQLRSGILELLTQQSAATLVTSDGKQALKAAIKARVAPELRKHKVIDVLFSEFVVQF